MSKLNVVWVLTLLWSLVSVAHGETYTPGKKVNKNFKSFAEPFLATHCGDCHGETDPEGNLSLTDLGPVDEVNSAVINQFFFQSRDPVEDEVDAIECCFRIHVLYDREALHGVGVLKLFCHV